MMSLKARGLGMRLRHIVRCTPGVRSASQPCQVYVQTSTMRVKRGRNSATAVLGGICLHLMRLLLATRGDCRRRVVYPGASVRLSIPVQMWPGQAGCAVRAGWRHGHGAVCHQ